MAKVFQILVPDNTLVSRIISCENQVTELFVIDRADKKFVSDYSTELNKPALYILVNRDKRQLYVGETDDSLKRLRNHEAKDFWKEAIVFHSTTDTLSTTEVKWLEAKTYEALKNLGFYDLSENKQVPQEPSLKKNQIYTLEPIFEEAKNYICAAGFDIFLRKKEDSTERDKSQAEPAKQAKHIFYCKQGGCVAKGYMSGDEFIMLAGSEIRQNTRASITPTFAAQRQAFIVDHCKVQNGVIMLKHDYTFPSPSYAAGMCVGGSANGWTEWKDAEGKTLDEVFRPGQTHTKAKTTKNSAVQRTGDKDLADKLTGKNIRLALNGRGESSKRSFVLNVIKTYLEEHPNTTFEELKQIFPQRLAGSWSNWPLLQDDFEYINNPAFSSRYKGKDTPILISGDGVKFMVLNQWDYNNLSILLPYIEGLGMSYDILKK